MTSERRVEASVTDLLVELARAGVDFVVVGGVACLLHGVQRTTADVDCCVPLDDANLARLVGVAKRLGLGLRAPEPLESLCDPNRRRAWIEENHATVATLVSQVSPLQLDVFLRYPVSYSDLRAHAVTYSLHGRSVFVSSREDLIRAKRAVVPERTVDRRDIEDLEELIRRDAT